MDEVDTIARGYECDIPPDFGTIFSKDKEAALEVVRRLASKVFRVGTYAAFNLEWDVLAVIFTVTDRLQHFWWSEGYRISELYKRLDIMLGEFIRSADEASADLMVVSDHGFGPCHKFVSINGFLEEAKLTVRTESTFSKMLAELGFTRGKMRKIMGAWPSTFTALPTFFQDMIRRVVPESEENLRELDTNKSLAFAKTPAGVFLRDDNMRDIVIKKLTELTDQTTGTPIVAKIMNRNDVLQGAYSYRAPDLFLEPSPGYGFSLDKADVERGFTGVHRPEGIFIHYRPNGGAQRLRNDLVRPWDVAATTLNILGVSVPSHFDGTPIIARD
jgi:predicted AlkP superfamily phosphohydrolase/phosphomutase